MVPAEAHVEQEPLVEEAAVELGADVERIVLGREIEDVEPGSGIGPGLVGLGLEEAGRRMGGSVATTGGGVPVTATLSRWSLVMR
jgi:hypothetical protein